MRDAGCDAEESVMFRATASEKTSPMSGLDVLRIGAVLLVTAQHALSLTRHNDWSSFRSLNVGQVGVTIFLGISALLGNTSRRRPVEWLVQRLRRLFPAYWLVMIVCFLLAWATSYKKFTPGQVVSQMLGTGFLTHPDSLVNVATWFITLLLVCYVCLFFARVVNRPVLVPLLLIFATILYAGLTDRLWPHGRYWSWMHTTTFFACSVLATACPANRRMQGFLAAGIVVLLGAPFSIAFVYTGLTLVLVGASLGIPEVPRVVHTVASYSYEYYLIHGIFLIATTRALRGYPVLAVVCGVSLAALASVPLQKTVRYPWAETIRDSWTLHRSSRHRAPGPSTVGSSSES